MIDVDEVDATKIDGKGGDSTKIVGEEGLDMPWLFHEQVPRFYNTFTCCKTELSGYDPEGKGQYEN
uniref:Uncharacterized protein n=1 Tax=Romanomermis culicivorax TaxID=13658 RepID=A0A915KRV2_ROMCU